MFPASVYNISLNNSKCLNYKHFYSKLFSLKAKTAHKLYPYLCIYLNNGYILIHIMDYGT